ncbi:uncharacterized protein LOC111082920 [Drosophila obscura]|uniref:uncharacterized protein LOC111082920 n=1 Tax=Drosophila obscura TaxID=7282 RepID=UPI001BB1E353|nr:uncharacterized protein LOC111082920 [Drosophila obscura]
MKLLSAILLANACYYSVNPSQIDREDTREMKSDATMPDGVIIKWKICIVKSTSREMATKSDTSNTIGTPKTSTFAPPPKPHSAPPLPKEQSDGTIPDGLIIKWKISIRKSTLETTPTTEEPSPSTTTPLEELKRPTKEDKQILKEQENIVKLHAMATNRLQNILNRFENKCGSNMELCWWISKVRYASRLGSNQLNEKSQIELMFHIYNRRRQKLEYDIEYRIDHVNGLLFGEYRDSSCFNFYRMQQRTLQESLNLTNAHKAERLTENSKICPYPDYDYYNENFNVSNYTDTAEDDDYAYSD